MYNDILVTGSCMHGYMVSHHQPIDMSETITINNDAYRFILEVSK